MGKGFPYISLLVALVIFLSYCIGSCSKKDAGITYNPTYVNLQVPDGFPQPTNNFSNNPLTKEGIALGRRLFYDGILSKDGNFPCSSCHQQFAAFATFDHNFSHGFNNSFTSRNAPGLWNLAWHSEFHHDGGINNLEVQPLASITAPNEMAENITDVVYKLKNDSRYRQLFREAFGDDEINSQRMLKAIAQFTGTLISAGSKYDQVKKGIASFTSFEQRGESVFLTKCANCHTPPLFTDLSYRNTGLLPNSQLNDKGRMQVTQNPEDAFKFKVPSLRNVAVTFPYMHDGRFLSLEQSIEHYRSIPFNPTLDPVLVSGIGLSNGEVIDLVQFLKTLTDSAFLKDERFSQPNF
jgi:cytochrome c peroxidase